MRGIMIRDELMNSIYRYGYAWGPQFHSPGENREQQAKYDPRNQIFVFCFNQFCSARTAIPCPLKI